MLRYIARRVLYMIPTLFGMSLVSFLIIQLPPGDYLTSMLASISVWGGACGGSGSQRSVSGT